MSARSKAKSQLPATSNNTDEHPGAAARVLSEIIERGARVQGPAVRAYVERLREGNPDATPAEIVTKLEKQYLAAVMASGAAVGSAAAFPGIGTLVALSAVAGETVVFLEATAVFVLAVAEVHGIPADASGTQARAGAGRAGRRGQQACDRRTARPRPDQRRVAQRRRGNAAAACSVAAEFAAAAVLRQAIRAQARGDRVRQAAAGRHRRRRRRRRQPVDGQADHRERPHGVRVSSAALAGETARAARAAGLKTLTRRLALLWRPRMTRKR